jgi:hypothetical protein
VTYSEELSQYLPSKTEKNKKRLTKIEEREGKPDRGKDEKEERNKILRTIIKKPNKKKGGEKIKKDDKAGNKSKNLGNEARLRTITNKLTKKKEKDRRTK